MGLSRAWAPAPSMGRKLSLLSTIPSNCRFSWSSFHSWSQTLLEVKAPETAYQKGIGQWALPCPSQINPLEIPCQTSQLTRAMKSLAADRPADWRTEMSSGTKILPKTSPPRVHPHDLKWQKGKKTQINQTQKSPQSKQKRPLACYSKRLWSFRIK